MTFQVIGGTKYSRTRPVPYGHLSQVAKWQVACLLTHYTTVVVGMITFGFVSDKLGRKPGMFLTTVRYKRIGGALIASL
jgi:hypothetical protein